MVRLGAEQARKLVTGPRRRTTDWCIAFPLWCCYVLLIDDALQIAELDANGDGEIIKTEFVHYFEQSLTTDPR